MTIHEQDRQGYKALTAAIETNVRRTLDLNCQVKLFPRIVTNLYLKYVVETYQGIG